MKKRVLIFSLAYFPKHVGGAEVAIKEITDRVPSSDFEFHMVTLRFDSTLPKIEMVGNVLVHRIGLVTRNPNMGDLRKMPLHLNKGLYQILAFFKAVQLHWRYRYDGIWAMMAHSCAVPAGLFKTFFPQVRYLLTLQEGDPPEYIEAKMRPFGSLFRRGFTEADVLQPISTFLEQWGRKMGFTGQSFIIPNAVNTKHFSQTYSETEIEAIKKELGKKSGDVFIITTSRLVHKNAVDVVILALSLVPQNIHFFIAGIGPDDRILKELAEKNGVAGRVHFLGQLSHSEMPKYLKACDIFARPSRSEGMGNSFVEAMAAGLPVIATQEGGIADFLFDKKRNPGVPPTGWAVDKDNPKQIAEAIKDIIEHPEQVRKVTETAKNLAFTKYDWDLIANDMKEKIFSILL